MNKLYGILEQQKVWLNCLEITVAIFSKVAGMLWFKFDEYLQPNVITCLYTSQLVHSSVRGGCCLHCTQVKGSLHCTEIMKQGGVKRCQAFSEHHEE